MDKGSIRYKDECSCMQNKSMHYRHVDEEIAFRFRRNFRVLPTSSRMKEYSRKYNKNINKHESSNWWFLRGFAAETDLPQRLERSYKWGPMSAKSETLLYSNSYLSPAVASNSPSIIPPRDLKKLARACSPRALAEHLTNNGTRNSPSAGEQLCKRRQVKLPGREYQLHCSNASR